MAKHYPQGYINPTTHEFIPFKKNRSVWPWIIAAIMLIIAIYAVTSRNKPEPAPTDAEKAVETKAKETEPVEDEKNPADELKSETPETETASAPKNGEYTIADVEFQYSDYVLGDKTGKWTMAICYSSTPPDTIAREIVDAFEPEIGVPLWICNLYLNTTTRIMSWGTTLDIAVTEYVKGEENRAEILGTGDLLRQTTIDLTEGDAP